MTSVEPTRSRAAASPQGAAADRPQPGVRPRPDRAVPQAVGRLRTGLADEPRRQGPVGDAARAGGLRGGAAQRRQGLRQRAGVDLPGRPVLRARPDVPRLRGAPPAPPDHAAGVHPGPARGVRRGDAPGDHRRPGAVAAGRRLQGVLGAQGPHPRHRHQHVHGRRRPHVGRGDGAGQPVLHRVRAGRRRDRAARRAVHPLAPRAARAGATSRSSSTPTSPSDGRPAPTTCSRCCATSSPTTASGSATRTS